MADYVITSVAAGAAILSLVVAILQLHLVVVIRREWRTEENNKLMHDNLHQLGVDVLTYYDKIVQLTFWVNDWRLRMHVNEFRSKSQEITDLRNAIMGESFMQESVFLFNKPVEKELADELVQHVVRLDELHQEYVHNLLSLKKSKTADSVIDDATFNELKSPILGRVHDTQGNVHIQLRKLLGTSK